MEPSNIDLPEDTEVESEPYQPISKCIRKCIRKSDRICYSDVINGTDAQSERGEAEESSASSDITQDSLKSGESLFKIFTFETSESNPDMKKCLAFWRTVLEKNLKPLKCNLIDDKNNQKAKKKSTVSPLNEENNFDEVTQKVTMMWGQAWKDVQKQRLDKVKLRPQQRCVVCDLVEFDIQNDADKVAEVTEIKKLNQWTPYSSRPTEEKMFNTPKAFSFKDKPETVELWKAETKETEFKVGNITVEVVESTECSQVKRQSSQVKREGTEVKREDTQIKQKDDQAQLADNQILEEYQMEQISSIVPCTTPENENFENIHLCSCGCTIENCVCAEFTSLDLFYKKSSATICSCSCGLAECICQEYTDPCICGCGVPGCTCEKLVENNQKCSCSCNLDFCICQNQVEKEISEVILKETASIGIQSEEIQKELKINKPMYCVICGHYDCYCRTENYNLSP